MKLEAEHRLLSFKGNSFGKSNLAVELWNTISETADQSTKFKKIGEAKGTSIWAYEEYVLATVPSETWAPVGCLQLQQNTDRYQEVQFSVVDKPFLGRGIGQLMYEAKLKDLGHLASSDDLSKGSSALWRRLVTKYKGQLVIPKYNSPTKKALKVAVVDWVVKGGITYPVVETPKGRKDLKQLASDWKTEGDEAALAAYYLIES